MIWQDAVFLCGSMLSVLFLWPTLRDAAARVPRATSVPSMVIGGAYSATFLTLGMNFSAVGSFAACSMWSLIATFRAPDNGSLFGKGVLPPASELRARVGGRVRPDGRDDASERIEEPAASNPPTGPVGAD